jgi:transposase
LGCLDAERPPFSKGTLVGFRARLIAHGLDRRLVEQTVALAKAKGGFGDRALRAALDASPLWGAGRVEDTINLMGHALRLVLGVLGGRQGWGLAAAARARLLADQADIGVLAGPSVKAALDLDWDDPATRQRALGVVLAALGQVEQLAAGLPGGDDPQVVDALAAARQVRDQDITVDPDGVPRIRQGVARDRRISIADPRCATAARPAACGSMATSGTCCATWTPSWFARLGSPRPTSLRPRSPSRSSPTWQPRTSPLASCTSIGRIWPAA